MSILGTRRIRARRQELVWDIHSNPRPCPTKNERARRKAEKLKDVMRDLKEVWQ